MAQNTKPVEVYLEVGKSRIFAVVPHWPGWCRSGRDEAAALAALHAYGPRYAQVLHHGALDFHPPSSADAFTVVERVAGTTTTDFGAPDVVLPQDTQSVDAAELERWQQLLRACWAAFDAAVEAAHGRSLRKGPRGGGRELAKIVAHVRDVDASYLSSIGGKLPKGKPHGQAQALATVREAILETMPLVARGEIPTKGPRGGERWPLHYFVRRLSWHELDHVWEIEDRAE